MSEPSLQTTQDMIDRMYDQGKNDLGEIFEWFMDEIEINDINEVTSLPEPEDAPIDEDAARGLIISIIFGTHLENEYPRKNVEPKSSLKSDKGEEQ